MVFHFKGDVLFVCFFFPHCCRDWHIVSLFFITSYFSRLSLCQNCQPSNKVYIFTAGAAGEEPKWGESGKDARDEPDNRCMDTSLLIQQYHTVCLQPYKRQLVLIYFIFLDQLLVTVWQLSLLRQAWVWLRVSHPSLTGYSHLLFPLWW